MWTGFVTDRVQVAESVAQQDGAASIQMSNKEQASLSIRQRFVRLLVNYLEIKLIGSRIMSSAKFPAFACASLHLGETQRIANDQILLIGSQMYKTTAHIVAHSAWARLS